MRHLRVAAMLWGLAYALWISAPAQAHGVRLTAEADGNAIVGLVRYADGTALRSGRVALHAAAPSTEQVIGWQTFSDSDGHFRFAAIPPGDYEISVQDGMGHRARLRVSLGDLPVARHWASGEAWRWRDLLAGLGYLAGLFGVAMWVAARRQVRT
jgi:nickel transport protein